MIASLGNSIVTFYARTGFVLDAAAATASVALDRAPSADCYLQIIVSGGTTGSGTVTVTGTGVGGASQSETISFSKNGVAQTTKRWKSDSSATVTTSGLADEATPPTLSVESIDASGQPQLTRKELAASRICRVSQTGREKWPSERQGNRETANVWIYVDYEETWTPSSGGIAREDSTGDEWLISGVEKLSPGSSFSNNGWRLSCRILNT